jgi:hypothetical protein
MAVNGRFCHYIPDFHDLCLSFRSVKASFLLANDSYRPDRRVEGSGDGTASVKRLKRRPDS